MNPYPQKFAQGSNIIADLPTVDVSFDIEAFSRLIKSHGVEFVHYRAMRCPIGMTDKGDVRQPDHKDHNCSNGFLYKEAGAVIGSFTGNSSKTQMADIGFLHGSSVQVTFDQHYQKESEDDIPDEVAVAQFDRFYLKEFAGAVINWQTVEAHITGVDRLQYPAVKVEHLVDAKGVEYEEGRDFVLDNGAIRWLTGGPGYDARASKGVLYVVRYRYIPFWYCSDLIHEVRVSRRENKYTGERALVRMPYAVLLKREIVFENEQRPEAASEGDIRDMPSSPSGSFGVR